MPKPNEARSYRLSKETRKLIKAVKVAADFRNDDSTFKTVFLEYIRRRPNLMDKIGVAPESIPVPR